MPKNGPKMAKMAKNFTSLVSPFLVEGLINLKIGFLHKPQFEQI